jgi:hypothetical protein
MIILADTWDQKKQIQVRESSGSKELNFTMCAEISILKYDGKLILVQ